MEREIEDVIKELEEYDTFLMEKHPDN